jgi:hypothetical protein
MLPAFASRPLARYLGQAKSHRVFNPTPAGGPDASRWSRSLVITLISTVIPCSTVPVAAETRGFQIVTALQTTAFGAPMFVVSC